VSLHDSTPGMPALVEIVGGDAASSPSMDALLDISMPVAIEIGRASMTVQEILQLGVGSVVQLDRNVGEPVDIYVSDRKFAQGEVVVMGEHFGVRITKVLAGPNGEGGL
jgi:flagellar motor switch protein FliN/FliY